jgi:hypothetical protein
MKTEDWKKLGMQLKKFWRPGDEIICTRIFRHSNNKCYLCGNTPLEWHHVLLNSISNETIDVEFSCVISMKKLMEEWGSDQKILFFKKYTEEAAHLNSQYAGTAEILEFNNNADVLIHLLMKPEELSYKQIKAIMDYTIKFKAGVEAELYTIAFSIYCERKYYIYEFLDETERTSNVEKSIANYIQKEWEDFQASEDEYSRQIYESISFYPSEEELEISEEDICYACKTKINSIGKKLCPKCKWVICPKCGSCGCGYSEFAKNKAANGENIPDEEIPF